MKRLMWIMSVLLLLLAANYSFAAEDEQKGASESAYEHASEKSVFNRFGDWFATVGRSEEERARIMEEREATRAAGRTGKRDKPSEGIEKKKAESSEKKVEKTEEMKETTEKEVEKSQKEAEKAKRKAEKEQEKAAQKAEEHKQKLEEAEEAMSSDEGESKGRKKGIDKGKGHRKE